MRLHRWTKWLLVTSLTALCVLSLVVWNLWDYRSGLTYLDLNSLLSDAVPPARGAGGRGGGDGVMSAEAGVRSSDLLDKRRHGKPLARYIERSCRHQRNTDRPTTNGAYGRIIVDDKHKLLFCSVPKVASLNWRRVLLVLSGRVDVPKPEDINHTLVFNKYSSLLPTLSKFNESAAQRRLRTYFKFMFVRNPFQRLLSAWRNKFESTLPSSLEFRRRYGPAIVSRYRRKNATEEPDPQDLYRTRADQILVRFPEFLRFLADKAESGKGMNPHWERFQRLCGPCLVRYDFVGKYETLEEDSRQILRDARLDGAVSFPSRASLYTHSSTASVMEQSYRDLPASLLKRLYRIFRGDFELFDYSVPGFMDFGDEP